MLFDAIRALALLGAANATPVIVAQVARDGWSTPLDFGYVMPDGERLFGSHKTWRGLMFGVLAVVAVGAMFELSLSSSVGFAVTSLAADAVSSAVKRRMHLKPGTESVGLDQIGEALLPLILFSTPLSLAPAEIVGVTAIFVLLDLATARLRHGSWLRQRRS